MSSFLSSSSQQGYEMDQFTSSPFPTTTTDPFMTSHLVRTSPSPSREGMQKSSSSLQYGGGGPFSPSSFAHHRSGAGVDATSSSSQARVGLKLSYLISCYDSASGTYLHFFQAVEHRQGGVFNPPREVTKKALSMNDSTANEEDVPGIETRTLQIGVPTKRLVILAEETPSDDIDLEATMQRCVGYSHVEEMWLLPSQIPSQVSATPNVLNDLDIFLQQAQPLDFIRSICAVYRPPRAASSIRTPKSYTTGGGGDGTSLPSSSSLSGDFSPSAQRHAGAGAGGGGMGINNRDGDNMRRRNNKTGGGSVNFPPIYQLEEGQVLGRKCFCKLRSQPLRTAIIDGVSKDALRIISEEHLRQVRAIRQKLTASKDEQTTEMVDLYNERDSLRAHIFELEKKISSMHTEHRREREDVKIRSALLVEQLNRAREEIKMLKLLRYGVNTQEEMGPHHQVPSYDTDSSHLNDYHNFTANNNNSNNGSYPSSYQQAPSALLLAGGDDASTAAELLGKGHEPYQHQQHQGSTTTTTTGGTSQGGAMMMPQRVKSPPLPPPEGNPYQQRRVFDQRTPPTEFLPMETGKNGSTNNLQQQQQGSGDTGIRNGDGYNYDDADETAQFPRRGRRGGGGDTVGNNSGFAVVGNNNNSNTTATTTKYSSGLAGATTTTTATTTEGLLQKLKDDLAEGQSFLSAYRR